MTVVRAIVLTGYGLNCDYETEYSLKLAGAEPHRVHINELIEGSTPRADLSRYHLLVFGGGFSWADDHGAGVVLASKLKFNMGEQIEQFIRNGKLVIGICNGFQSLVNLGLLPGFEKDYKERRVALASNDSGNMLCEIRNALLLSRLRGQESWLTPREVLRYATRGGAEVLGRDDIGQIAEGKRADLCLFSLRGIEYAGSKSDPAAALVFNQRQSCVDYLIIEGKIVIKDGETGIDEGRLADEHDRISNEMLVNAVKRTGIDFFKSK